MTASEILRPKEDKKDVKGLSPQDLMGCHLPGDKKAWLGEFWCVGRTNLINHPETTFFSKFNIEPK